MPLPQRKRVVELIMNRWAYLHSPVHSAAYVLNPRFVGADHFGDTEVRDDFFAVLSTMLGDIDKLGEAIGEYSSYHKKTNLWSQQLIWVQVKSLEPAEWWSIWSSNAPLLAPIAIQILNAAHGAGGVERNLSTQGFVNSDRRGSQKTATIARQTRLAANQKLYDKRMVRGTAHKQAAARQNAKRLGMPPPKRDEPKQYPLETDLEDWGSCDESDGTDDDLEVLRGPQLELETHAPRRPVPAAAPAAAEPSERPGAGRSRARRSGAQLA